MRTRPLMQSAIGHFRTPLYLNAYALMVSNLLSSGLGVVYWSLAARLYRVEDVGVSAAVISTVMFLTGISQLNLRMALLRLVPSAGARTARLIWSAYGLSLVITAVVAVLVFSGMAMVGSSTLALAGLPTIGGVLFLTLGTMASSIFNLQDGVLAGLRRTVWVPVENAFYSAAKILLLLVFAAMLPALGIVVSWFVPMFLVVVVVTAVLVLRWIPAHMAARSGRGHQLQGRRLLNFVAADYVGAMFTLAVQSLLPVLILIDLGARTGAYFAIVWTIGTSLNLLPINLCASLTVETVHSGGDLATEVRKAGIHMALLLLPLVAVILVFAEWILRIFGPDYSQAGTVALRLIALAVIPVSVNTLFMATSRIRGHARQILVVQAVLACLTLAGSAVLLGPLGINGVPLAWLVSQSLVALVLGIGFLRPMIMRSSTGGAEGGPAPEPAR